MAGGNSDFLSLGTEIPKLPKKQASQSLRFHPKLCLNSNPPFCPNPPCLIFFFSFSYVSLFKPYFIHYPNNPLIDTILIILPFEQFEPEIILINRPERRR